MPVEIRELHIKVLVQGDSQNESNPTATSVSPTNVDAIVAECVEQVVKIIKDKKER
ncbi:MAG TPA: DUF5908 family protein [Chryseolinea sp.]